MEAWTLSGPLWLERGVVAAYFIVLGLLAVCGLHRCWLVCAWLRYRHNLPGPPPGVARWPKVTIQLPVYNERYVVGRLLEACARLDYPREQLEIQVLDDSTDDTPAIAAAGVARLRAAGIAAAHLRRASREGYKAGALGAGLRSADGEFMAIFDADFIPPPDFLRRTVPYLAAEPRLGCVQARWTHLNAGYSLLTRVQAILLDGHFVVEHGARCRSGAFFNFNGSAGVWRRAAIESAGGWQHDTLTEDTDLSYRAQLAGWKFLYLPEVEAPAELPVEMSALLAQQARWARGLLQTARKLLPAILRSAQPAQVKAAAAFHLTAPLAYPLMVALSLLLAPAMALRTAEGWSWSLLADAALLAASLGALSSFYLLSQRALDPRRWPRTFLWLPLVMAAGVALCARNAAAALAALAGPPGEFARTPKYRIEGPADTARGKSYRRRAGWWPAVEIALGLYLAAGVALAAAAGSYPAVPFLMMFAAGYLYAGLMSLGQSLAAAP